MGRSWIGLGIAALQACILFTNLNLLPAWSDEAGTSKIVQQPVLEMMKTVRTSDIHPPLYYLLLHVWPWHGIAGLRAVSALWSVIAVLLLDRFWTREWRPRHRILALSLFAFSPCLLLYGRMARSYSMQTALTIAAVALLWRWMRTGNGAIAAGTASLALLYTHYAPAIAILIGFALVGWISLGIRRIGLFGAAMICGYLPWLLTFSSAIREWIHPTHFAAQYRITGSAFIEPIVKLGYTAVSLTIGETFHPASLIAVPLLLFAIYRGARRAPGRLAAMVAIAAIAGYLAVSQWVSYAFIAARMLWVLPFLALAAAAGLARQTRASRIAAVLIAVSYGTSIVAYFEKAEFLNRGYVAPLREIAAELNRSASPSDIIVIDAFNTDATGLKYYLRDPSQAVQLYVENAAPVESQFGRARTVWIIRNERDISPGHLTTTVEQDACATRRRNVSSYLPFEPWQEALLKRLLREPPAYFYQVVRCSSP